VYVLQALSIRKDDPYALVARAKTYARMGIVKESLDDVNTVLKEDPDNHQVCTSSALDTTGTENVGLVDEHKAFFLPGLFPTEWYSIFTFSR